MYRVFQVKSANREKGKFVKTLYSIQDNFTLVKRKKKTPKVYSTVN